jgi:hypothetical protein
MLNVLIPSAVKPSPTSQGYKNYSGKTKAEDPIDLPKMPVILIHSGHTDRTVWLSWRRTVRHRINQKSSEANTGDAPQEHW